MRRRTVIASVGALLGTSVGAAAYTSATVSRDATFTVAADTNALVGLAAGSAPGVTETTSGELAISIADLNTESTFTFGNSTDLTTDFAFSITNNDTIAHDIAVAYGTTGVTFQIYKPGTNSTDGSDDWTAATIEATVDASDGTTDQDLSAMASGAEYRVVMTVDTTGVASGATTLDGTLTFTSN